MIILTIHHLYIKAAGYLLPVSILNSSFYNKKIQIMTELLLNISLSSYYEVLPPINQQYDQIKSMKPLCAHIIGYCIN